MKPHVWTLHEDDGGSVGFYEHYRCDDCGACGGVPDANGELDARSRPFVSGWGSSALLPDDCEIAKDVVEMYARVDRLEVQLATTLDALRPFALRCEDYERNNKACGRYQDDAPLELEGRGSLLTVADLRRALEVWGRAQGDG